VAEHAAQSGGRVDDYHRAHRLAVSRQETPTILLWAGVLVLIVPIVNFLVPPRSPLVQYLVTVALGLVFVGTSFVLRRPSVPNRAIPWVFATCTVVLVVLLLFQYHWDPRAVNLVWVVGVMLAFGPGTEEPAPFAVAAVLTYAALAAALFGWGVADPLDWLMVAAASLVIGYVLLRRRLRTLDALADAHRLADRLAMTDALTAVLNRHGLLARLDPLEAVAVRTGSDVFAVFVDVRGLKAANDVHGHDFGDEVLVRVAAALEACVRRADLVARWGGDEFVVVGIGAAPEPDVLEHRISRHVTGGGLDLARWAGQVSVGCAHGPVRGGGVAALIQRADSDMYRRRQRVPRPRSDRRTAAETTPDPASAPPTASG
jgi:diguanylate cyclase (GGDEF)-like protein